MHMLKQRSIQILTLGAALLSWTGTALPQEQKPQPQPKSDLSKWWQKSSLSYSPRPQHYLFHTEATISFMDLQGNADGTMFTGDVGVAIRRSRFTSRFTADLSKQEVVYTGGGGSTDLTENTIRVHNEYDLTKNLLVVGGVEHYKNSVRFIDDRVTLYGGMGITLFENEKHQLAVNGGLGYVRFDFDEKGIGSVNPEAISTLPTLNASSGGAMVMQMWRWNIHRGISFTQNSEALDYFNSELGSRWSLSLDLNLPLAASNWASVTIGYEIKHEENIYTDALGVKPQDRSLRIGFRVSK